MNNAMYIISFYIHENKENVINIGLEVQKYRIGQLNSLNILMNVFVLTFGSSKFVSTTFGRASTLEFKSSGVLRKNLSFSSPSFTFALLSTPFGPKIDSI
jgi:hypothetical protein